jgi:hypothetical protein
MPQSVIERFTTQINADPRLQEPKHNPFYKVARDITFGMERPNSHRLTRSDLDLLRTCTDRELVEKLEYTLVVGRSMLFLTSLLGGASEGLVTYVSAGELQTDQTLSSSALEGMLAVDFLSESVQSNVKSRVGKQLGQILDNIAGKYTADARLYHLGDLHGWAQRLTGALADAEEVTPVALEVLPSMVGISGGLAAASTDNLSFLKYAVVYALSAFLTNAVSSDTHIHLPLWLKNPFAHLLASGTKYAAVIASSGSSGGNSLNTILASLAASHLYPGLEDNDEVLEGRSARAELHEVINHLQLTISTLPQLIQHNNAIKEKFDHRLAYRRAGPDSDLKRYLLMDEALRMENIRYPESNSPIYLLLHDFRVDLGEKTLLSQGRNDLLLRGGKVYCLIAESGMGKSVILKAIGGDYTHQSGQAIIRHQVADFEQHQAPFDFIVYLGCKNIPHESLSSFNILKPDEKLGLLFQLARTGMFSTEELDMLSNGLEGQNSNRSLRSRLAIFLTFFFHPNTPVYIFDDLYEHLSDHEADSVSTYITVQTQQKGKLIILSSTNEVPKDIKNTYQSERVWGGNLRINDLKLIKE